MSIDNLFDTWTREQGIRRRAEVVPDNPCQVFSEDVSQDGSQGGVGEQSVEAQREALEAARDRIGKILNT